MSTDIFFRAQKQSYLFHIQVIVIFMRLNDFYLV